MILNLLITFIITAVFILYCLLIGMAVFKQINPKTDFLNVNSNFYLISFFAITLGISITILEMMILGFGGLITPVAVVIIGVSTLAVSLASCSYKQSGIQNIQLNALPIPILLVLLTVAFAWKAPGHWDDTSFHLPLARFYVDQQQILLHEYLRFPLFPQNMNMLITLGHMMGGATLAQVFATIPWFVISLGLMGTCKWFMGSPLPGLFAALVLAKLIGAFKVGFGYAYVDTGLAMFCWAAILTTIIGVTNSTLLPKERSRWIVIAGIFAGGAAGTKIFGGVFAFLLCIYILFATRSLLLSLKFGIFVLMAGIWWYLRSYLISGDPFHPIGGNIFGHFLWNDQDLANQIHEQSLHGVTPSFLNIWPSLQKAGIEFWSLSFIGLLFYRRYPKPIRALQIIFISYFCFWFFVTQVERYLSPIVVMGTFLSIYTIYYLLIETLKNHSAIKKMFSNSKFYTGLTIFMCCVIAFGDLRRGITKWDERLKKFNGYELFTEADALQKNYGGNLVQIGFENAAYFFSGITIGDVFGKARYSQMIDCQNEGCNPIDSNSMIRLLKRFDSKMIVISTKQYSTFDPKEYEDHFDLLFRNNQGVLMAVKK